MTQDFQGSVIWCHLAVSGDGPRTPRHSRSHSFTFERLNGLPVDGARSKNAPTPSTSYVPGPLSVRTAFALARQAQHPTCIRSAQHLSFIPLNNAHLGWPASETMMVLLEGRAFWPRTLRFSI